MLKKPLFSIIIVTFNAEKTLEKSLKSLFDQTFTNWEVLIIDGLSTDSTNDVVKKYLKRIGYFISEKDSGIYDAMNKGAQQAKGEFLYFLNADDIFFDNEVLDFVSKNINKDLDLITANVLKVYNKKSVLKKNKLNENNLKYGLMPPHQSMFLRKSTFDKINGFDTRYKSSGDFELCCKLLKLKIKNKYLNRNIAFFKSGGMSANKKIAYFETFEIIKSNFGTFYGNLFYIKKILLEQGFKKILKHLI